MYFIIVIIIIIIIIFIQNIQLKINKDIAHYAPYALAAYSTLMFLYINPGCGLCELCHYSACISPMGSCNPCAKTLNVSNANNTPTCCCTSCCGR